MEWGLLRLEEMERLEQLRVLWNGGRVHLTQAKESVPLDVNTEERFRTSASDVERKEIDGIIQPYPH